MTHASTHENGRDPDWLQSYLHPAQDAIGRPLAPQAADPTFLTEAKGDPHYIPKASFIIYTVHLKQQMT